MPVPLMISAPPTKPYGGMENVKEAELEANTMLFTSCDVEMFTPLCED